MKIISVKFLTRLIALFFTCVTSFLLFACNNSTSQKLLVPQEELFTISYGFAEDQLNLFQNRGDDGPPVHFAMRDGIFYFANTRSHKLVRFSSYGNILSMIYDPKSNPPPLVLKNKKDDAASASRDVTQGNDNGASLQQVVSYPFQTLGPIAVDSRQNLYVTDKLPIERQTYDQTSKTYNSYVVLRSDKDGVLSDYLGQEGLGGSPFPYITGIYTTATDDVIVLATNNQSWTIAWFDVRGSLKSNLKIARNALPMPPNAPAGLIPVLDSSILPDNNGNTLVLKIDYYKASTVTNVPPANDDNSNTEDDVANTSAPLATGDNSAIPTFIGEWIFKIDASTGEVRNSFEIPLLTATEKANPAVANTRVRIPRLLGVSDNHLVLLRTNADEQVEVMIFDTLSYSLKYFVIDREPQDSIFNAFFLSPEGVLCGLLGKEDKAHITTWHFEQFLGKAGFKATARSANNK